MQKLGALGQPGVPEPGSRSGLTLEEAFDQRAQQLGLLGTGQPLRHQRNEPATLTEHRQRAFAAGAPADLQWLICAHGTAPYDTPGTPG